MQTKARKSLIPCFSFSIDLEDAPLSSGILYAIVRMIVKNTQKVLPIGIIYSEASIFLPYLLFVVFIYLCPLILKF